MIETKEITIDAGDCNFMSEFMNDLPENVLLNKISTGCGGTTVALSNDIPYVVVVPYRAMITNKKKWADEVGIELQPVMGGIEEEEILQFNGIKYIVTYNSLGILTELLGNKVNDYKILIDESHNLVISGGFRREAVYIVLENYTKYKAFTFMTATPVPDKFQLPELAGIKKVRIEWNNLTEVKVDYMEINNDFNKTLAMLAIDYLDGKHGDDNMHMFMNSVNSIISVVKILNKAGQDTLKNANIVCAGSDRNYENISKQLGANYTISNVGDVRKLNFYTSTAFEGSDIYDEHGQIYIGVNGFKDYTKVNILVTLPQIAGRIRNTKYKNKITLMYIPEKGIINMDEKDYEIVVENEIESAKSSVKVFNSMESESDRVAFITGHRDSAYLFEHHEELKVNSTALMSQMAAYHTIHSTYYAGGLNDKSGSYNGVEYVYSQQENNININALSNIKLSGEGDFEELCRLYHAAKSDNDLDTIEEIEFSKPFIKEAYDSIGFIKMKSLRFVQKSIRDEIAMKKRFTTQSQTIVEMLGLKTGDIIIRNDIKRRLQDIYNKLELKKVAVFTHLEDWYSTKRVMIKGIRLDKIITVNINI